MNLSTGENLSGGYSIDEIGGVIAKFESDCAIAQKQSYNVG
jgi:hypothetical protein